ncbi:hypothetical protein F4801DRAFT_579716 [Xylaria longipes]|nr:hypothetical protein F4801DRAFT_579716 [Xylaria longipes]
MAGICSRTAQLPGRPRLWRSCVCFARARAHRLALAQALTASILPRWPSTSPAIVLCQPSDPSLQPPPSLTLTLTLTPTLTLTHALARASSSASTPDSPVSPPSRDRSPAQWR